MQQAVLARGDKNGDGQLNFQEFSTLVAVAIAVERQPNKADAAFGAAEARSVNEVADSDLAFPFSLIANGKRITKVRAAAQPTGRHRPAGSTRRRPDP